MSRWHSIEANSYSGIIIDSGALYLGYTSPASPGTLIGATRGGTKFQLKQTVEDIEYEGLGESIVSDLPSFESSKIITGVTPYIEADIISRGSSISDFNFYTAIMRSSSPDTSESGYYGRYRKIGTRKEMVQLPGGSIAIVGQVTGMNNPIIVYIDNPIIDTDLALPFRDKEETTFKLKAYGTYDRANGFEDSVREPWGVFFPTE